MFYQCVLYSVKHCELSLLTLQKYMIQPLDHPSHPSLSVLKVSFEVTVCTDLDSN